MYGETTVDIITLGGESMQNKFNSLWPAFL